MTHETPPELAVPQALIARLKAAAAAERRQPRDVLRDAVEFYLRDRQLTSESTPRRSPAEAAAHMRDARKGNILPDGVTIHDLLTSGRA